MVAIVFLGRKMVLEMPIMKAGRGLIPGPMSIVPTGRGGREVFYICEGGWLY